MTDFLSVDDVLALHRELIATSGGSHGVRDLGAVESAVAQPQMTFDGEDFYPTLPENASALAFPLISNRALC
jgi:death-on-curing protein